MLNEAHNVLIDIHNIDNSDGHHALLTELAGWVNNIKIDITRDRMGWYGLDRCGSG
jgi:hypothetical protein